MQLKHTYFNYSIFVMQQVKQALILVRENIFSKYTNLTKYNSPCSFSLQTAFLVCKWTSPWVQCQFKTTKRPHCFMRWWLNSCFPCLEKWTAKWPPWPPFFVEKTAETFLPPLQSSRRLFCVHLCPPSYTQRVRNDDQYPEVC